MDISDNPSHSPHEETDGSSKIDLSKTTALHSVFGFIIGLLIALVGLKFLGSGTNPFITQYWTMSLFIMASFVYTLAVLAEIMLGGAANTSDLFMYVYLISGAVACELLGFVLVGPFGLLLMNPLAYIIIELLRRLHQQISTPAEQTTTTTQEIPIAEDPEVGVVQMKIQSSY